MLKGQTTYGREGKEIKKCQYRHSYFPHIVYTAYGDIQTRLNLKFWIVARTYKEQQA